MDAESGAVDQDLARLLDEPDASADRDRTIPTNLKGLDDLLSGGLRTSQTTVVASRTGEGASTFALGVARSAALHHHLPTVFLSPEAPESEVALRVVSAETHIPLRRLRSRTLDGHELDRLRVHRERLSTAPLSSVTRLLTGVPVDRARSAMAEGARLVVVDAPSAVPREAVQDLTASARQHHCALVLVLGAHSDRSHEERAPELHDMRDSDALSDLVDTVLMLHPRSPPDVDVHLAKHRYGATGTVRIAHIAHTCSYVNTPAS